MTGTLPSTSSSSSMTFQLVVSHECTLTVFTQTPITASSYTINGASTTVANLDWTIDRTPQCLPITYEIRNQADNTLADSIFTVGASTVTVYSTINS